MPPECATRLARPSSRCSLSLRMHGMPDRSTHPCISQSSEAGGSLGRFAVGEGNDGDLCGLGVTERNSRGNTSDPWIGDSDDGEQGVGAWRG